MLRGLCRPVTSYLGLRVYDIKVLIPGPIDNQQKNHRYSMTTEYKFDQIDDSMDSEYTTKQKEKSNLESRVSI